jgi:hypothetical protein
VRRFGHVVSALGWGTHALAPLSFRAGTYRRRRAIEDRSATSKTVVDIAA